MVAVVEVEEEEALEELEAEEGEEGVEEGDLRHIQLRRQLNNQHQRVVPIMIGKLFLVVFVIIPGIVHIYARKR